MASTVYFLLFNKKISVFEDGSVRKGVHCLAAFITVLYTRRHWQYCFEYRMCLYSRYKKSKECLNGNMLNYLIMNDGRYYEVMLN